MGDGDTFKGFAIVLIWAMALLGGSIPLAVERYGGKRQGGCCNRLVPVLNAATAGVFIAASLMHMLADAIANEELRERSLTFWGDESLNALALCAAGFLGLFAAEQVAIGFTIEDDMAFILSEGGLSMDDVALPTEDGLHTGAAHPDRPSEEVERNPTTPRTPGSSTVLVQMKTSTHNAANPTDANQTALQHNNVEQTSDGKNSAIVAVTIAAGLSLHSTMEGIALGAQEHSALISIFAAIIAHKGIAAFALGTKMFQVLKPRKHSYALFCTCMFVFSLTTPIGIGIGWTVTSAEDSEHSMWPAIFSALGAGTFLFVALIEVIPSEFSHGTRDRGKKTAALLLSFMLMGGLAKWA